MRNIQRLLLSSLLIFGLALPVAVAEAAGSGGSSSGSSSSGGSSSSSSVDKNFMTAKNKIAAGNYKAAVPLLEGVIKKQPKNADALNLLGYSHRKLGDFETALAYYLKALKIKPNHVGANEYLGELYLEMKDLPKAEERLAVLTKACNGCEEQKDLEEAIADYKAANS